MGSLPQILSQAMSDYQAGRLQNAERLYHEALAIYPEHPDALNMLGVIAMRTGRSSMAGELFQRAINATPGISQYHGNLGLALARQGRLEEAIAAYRKSLSLKPDYADSYNNLGNALLATGSVSEAVDAFMAAIKHRPDFVEAHSNLGSALQKLGKVDEGVAEYRKAIALNPNYAQAHNNLANGLRDLGKIDGACAELRTAMRLAPGNTAIGSNYVYTMSYHPATGSEDLCRAERQWNQQHAAPLSKLIANHSNDRNPDRKLRIGYISGDFRDHIAGKMILPLLLHRDRKQFEVLCYYNGVQSDEMTAKFRAQSDGFRSIVGMDDDSAARQIRSDSIDILVDCSGHMGGNRLLVVARKPAPVQIMFISYPGSTGLDALDYRLTDPYLDPPGTDESLYSEKTIHLSDTFWCFDPESMDAPREPINELPAIKNGYVTFGCVNNFVKVNDGVLELWSRVMREVPNSHLLLLAPEGEGRRRVTEKMKKEGIESSRLEFVPRVGREEYLRYFSRMDIGLDTVPYNGHTTSLDGMWMGVATVTLMGRTIVGRAGFSELSNVGLSELAAKTPEEFVKVASELGKDVDRQRQLREGMRERMARSPLCDAARWVSNVESVYRQVWRKWCGGSEAG